MRWSDHRIRRALPALALGLCLPAALAGCGGSAGAPAATGTAASSAAASPAASASKAGGGTAACATVTRDWTEFLAGKLKATAPGENDFEVLMAALSATFAGDTTLANFPDKDIDALAADSAAIGYVGVLDAQNAEPFNKQLAVVARDCKTTLKPLPASATGVG
jgi:hypothetical protein